MKINRLAISMLLTFGLMVSGCEPGKLFDPTITPTPTQTPTQTPTSTQTPTLVPSLTPSPTRIAINAGNIDRMVRLARYGKGSAKNWGFSPDGKLFAVGTPFGVDIYDSSTLEAVRTLESTSVYEINFSPDGEYLAAGLTTTVQVWRVSDGTQVQTLGSAHHMQAIAFSPDSKILAAGTNSCSVILWRVSDGKRLFTLKHDGGVTGVAFSPDGKMVAGVSNALQGNKVWVWHLTDGELVRILVGPTTDTSSVKYEFLVGVDFSPDGTLLAAGSYVNTSVLVWRLSDGTLVQTLEGMEPAFSPDGTMLATTYAGQNAILGDEKILFFKISDWSLVRTIPGYGLGFSPDWNLLAYSNGGSLFGDEIKMLDLQTGTVKETLEGYYSSPTSLAFSPDGTRLASGHANGTVRIWNNSDKTLENTFNWYKPAGNVFYRSGEPSPHKGSGIIIGSAVTNIAFSPDANWMVSCFGDASAYLWDSSQGVAYALNGDNKSAAFSPDGNSLATVSKAGLISLWQVSEQRLVRTFDPAPNSYIYQVGTFAFSQDGALIALVFNGYRIAIWKVANGKLVTTLNGSKIAFTPDGMIWTANDGEAQFWNTADWSLLRTMPLTNYVDDLAFSLKNGLVVTSAGSSIYFNQLSDGTLLKKMVGLNPDSYILAFSPDGSMLAVGSVDHTITLWGIGSP